MRALETDLMKKFLFILLKLPNIGQIQSSRESMMTVSSMILSTSLWKLSKDKSETGLFQDQENALQVSTSEF